MKITYYALLKMPLLAASLSTEEIIALRKQYKKEERKYKYQIKKYGYNFVIISLICLCTSCVTRKACEKRFPQNSFDSMSTIVTNTIIKYKDTTVFIKIPGDTVNQIMKVQDGISKLSTPFSTSYASVKNGKLIHNLEQKDTLLRKRLSGTLEKTTYSKFNMNKKQVTTSLHPNFFKKYLNTIKEILIGCILVILLYRLFIRR